MLRRALPSATLAALLTAALSLAPPAVADEVHLTNGESFEGVIATVEGDRVAVRLPHGVIRLPASRVLRVEKSTSVFERFLERSAELTGSGDARAWLDLALWAEERELSSGVRDAALRAARLDPELPGLAPLMRDLGHGFDEEAGVWLPVDDLMRRRGLVRMAGEWVPAEVAADAALRAAEERQRRAVEAREARLDRVITLLAMAQLQEAEEEREEAAVVVVPYGTTVGFGAPVATFHGGLSIGGGVRHGPVRRDPRHAGHRGQRHIQGKVHHQGFTWNDVARRQPGSIIPLALDSGGSH